MSARTYSKCRNCGEKIELVTWFEHLGPYWRHWDTNQLECAPATRAEPIDGGTHRTPVDGSDVLLTLSKHGLLSNRGGSRMSDADELLPTTVTEFGGILLTEDERQSIYEEALVNGLSDHEAREKAWPSVNPDEHRSHDEGFADDGLWANVGPWHCGLCAQDTDGCECGEPLMLIVRVPGLTPSETDHNLTAMSLVAMLNDQRVENYEGPEGYGPAPIRLLASGWRSIQDEPVTP